MSVYITRNAGQRTKVDSFERRGLTNQTSAKVSEMSIMSVSPRPISNLIRFSHMSAELKCRLDGSSNPYDTIPRSILRRISGDAPFEGPTLIVEMKTGGEVLNGLGLFEVATSKQAIYGGQPSVPNFTQICKLGVDFYQNVPAGNVNIAGYVAFVQAWRGVRAFFAVGGQPVEEMASLELYITPPGAQRIAPRAEIPAQVNQEGIVMREAISGTAGGGFVSVESQTQFATGDAPLVDGIPTIDASTEDLDFGGLLFPYFREMLEPDVDFAFSVFASLYSLCLEDGEGPSAESLTVHRRGFRYLANTHAGRIIQHVYLGIRLSIDSGAGLVLVKDGGDYAGFILSGPDFRIAVQNRVYRSTSSLDLSVALSLLDIHNKTLKEVYDLLLTVPRIGGTEETRTLDEMKKNPRVIREMVQIRTPEGIDSIRADLADKLKDLKYQQTFWEINADNVARFLDALVSKPPFEDEPMYLHIDVLCSRSSDILQYLSVFGIQAPSIYHGTKTLSIARPGNPDPNLEVVDERRKVPHIPFSNKGIIAAGLDWASVYRQKSFRYTPVDPKYGGRGFSLAKKRDGFVGTPQFDLFYENLRRWVFTGVAPEARVKRKSAGQAPGDDEEVAPPPKKTKFVFM